MPMLGRGRLLRRQLLSKSKSDSELIVTSDDDDERLRIKDHYDDDNNKAKKTCEDTMSIHSNNSSDTTNSSSALPPKQGVGRRSRRGLSRETFRRQSSITNLMGSAVKSAFKNKKKDKDKKCVEDEAEDGNSSKVQQHSDLENVEIIADDNGDIWEEDLNHDSFSVMEISQTELEANTSRILLDQNTNNEFEPQWRRKNRTPTSAATIHVTKDGSDDIGDEQQGTSSRRTRTLDASLPTPSTCSDKIDESNNNDVQDDDDDDSIDIYVEDDKNRIAQNILEVSMILNDAATSSKGESNKRQKSTTTHNRTSKSASRRRSRSSSRRSSSKRNLPDDEATTDKGRNESYRKPTSSRRRHRRRLTRSSSESSATLRIDEIKEPETSMKPTSSEHIAGRSTTGEKNGDSNIELHGKTEDAKSDKAAFMTASSDRKFRRRHRSGSNGNKSDENVNCPSTTSRRSKHPTSEKERSMRRGERRHRSRREDFRRSSSADNVFMTSESKQGRNSGKKSHEADKATYESMSTSLPDFLLMSPKVDVFTFGDKKGQEFDALFNGVKTDAIVQTSAATKPKSTHAAANDTTDSDINVDEEDDMIVVSFETIRSNKKTKKLTPYETVCKQRDGLKEELEALCEAIESKGTNLENQFHEELLANEVLRNEIQRLEQELAQSKKKILEKKDRERLDHSNHVINEREVEVRALKQQVKVLQSQLEEARTRTTANGSTTDSKGDDEDNSEAPTKEAAAACQIGKLNGQVLQLQAKLNDRDGWILALKKELSDLKKVRMVTKDDSRRLDEKGSGSLDESTQSSGHIEVERNADAKQAQQRQQSVAPIGIDEISINIFEDDVESTTTASSSDDDHDCDDGGDEHDVTIDDENDSKETVDRSTNEAPKKKKSYFDEATWKTKYTSMQRQYEELTKQLERNEKESQAKLAFKQDAIDFLQKELAKAMKEKPSSASVASTMTGPASASLLATISNTVTPPATAAGTGSTLQGGVAGRLVERVEKNTPSAAADPSPTTGYGVGRLVERVEKSSATAAATTSSSTRMRRRNSFSNLFYDHDDEKVGGGSSVAVEAAQQGAAASRSTDNTVASTTRMKRRNSFSNLFYDSQDDEDDGGDKHGGGRLVEQAQASTSKAAEGGGGGLKRSGSLAKLLYGDEFDDDADSKDKVSGTVVSLLKRGHGSLSNLFYEDDGGDQDTSTNSAAVTNATTAMDGSGAVVRSLLKKGHGSLTNLFYDQDDTDNNNTNDIGGNKNATWNISNMQNTSAAGDDTAAGGSTSTTVRSLLKKGHGSLTNLFYDEVYEDDHRDVNVRGGTTTTTSTKNATWNTADLGSTLNALTTSTTTRVVGSLMKRRGSLNDLFV